MVSLGLNLNCMCGKSAHSLDTFDLIWTGACMLRTQCRGRAVKFSVERRLHGQCYEDF